MNKKIMIMWFIIVFALLGTLYVIGLSKKDLTYVKLEYKIKYETYKYIKDKDINYDTTYTLDINKLIDEKYITDKYIDKYCIKEVKINSKLIFDEYTLIKKCEEI